MNLFDLLTSDALMDAAWDYYKDVQTKDEKYIPLLSAEDTPAIHLNEQIMATYKERMKKFYYDPSKFDTYLEQLGITYPTVKE